MPNDFVEITDVTLRDGIQMEASVLPTPRKLALLEKLTACGYPRIEITSFVNPKWVPQFQDAEAFAREAAASPAAGKSEWMAFVPNEKGLERLLAFPIPWACAFVAATEAFNKKNVNQTIAESLDGLARTVKRAHAEGRKIRVYVSTVFGCPYEGAVPLDRLMPTLERVASLGPDEIALSDTIGVALPESVAAVVGRFARAYPVAQMALHLHNTYGVAIGSALAGVAAGVRKLDASTGGLGGCPYAKGATGNVATEDLAYALSRAGKLPRFPLDAVKEALRFLEKDLGLGVRSRLAEIFDKGGTPYGLQQ